MEQEQKQITVTAEELAELEALRAEKQKKAEAEQRKADREAYSQMVDETLAVCIEELKELSEQIRKVKGSVYGKFAEILRLKTEVLGLAKSDNQKSHTFTDTESQYRIALGHYCIDAYRDTAEDGIAKVTNFINSLAKDEESKILVSAVMKLLAKDQKGTLKASRVIQLRRMAEESGNEEFIEGVKIIEEAYQPTESCTFIRAEVKDENGKWQNIPLNVTDC